MSVSTWNSVIYNLFVFCDNDIVLTDIEMTYLI